MRIFKWVVTGIIGLVVVLLGLVYFNVLPGYHVYIVRSGSMSPTVNTGDLAIVAPADSFLGGAPAVGSIISFTSENETVTHRIISINEDGSFITKGDDNEDPDARPVSLSQVQGIYSFRVPLLGYAAGFIRTKIGWFSLVIIPAFLLVGWIVRDIVKEALRKEPRPLQPVPVTARPVKHGPGRNHHFSLPKVRIRLRKRDPVKEYLEEVLKNIEFK